MEQLLTKLLSDFGITWWLYVFIIVSLMWYLPKLVKMHFNMIEKLAEKHERNIDKIIQSFEKQIEKSDNWHKIHQETLNAVHSDVKEVKNFIIKKL